MEESKLQSRYAQSLYDLAVEGNKVERIFADMTLINEVCKQNHLFEVVLKDPIIKPLKKKDILMSLFEDRCDELTIKFLYLIVSKRRDIYLRGISEAFIIIYRQQHGIKLATLTTAGEIDKKDLDSIRQKLETELNCKIEMRVKKDDSLIGGFCVDVDGRRYDASFVRKLEDIRKNITKQI